MRIVSSQYPGVGRPVYPLKAGCYSKGFLECLDLLRTYYEFAMGNKGLRGLPIKKDLAGSRHRPPIIIDGSMGQAWDTSQ